jgi:hypothetical protein
MSDLAVVERGDPHEDAALIGTSNLLVVSSRRFTSSAQRPEAQRACTSNVGAIA